MTGSLEDAVRDYAEDELASCRLVREGVGIVLAELDALRIQVAAVRELHTPDPKKAKWGQLVCAGCATHVTFTPWPCATAKALGEAS